jgi:hypothetical protein
MKAGMSVVLKVPRTAVKLETQLAESTVGLKVEQLVEMKVG